MTPEDQEQLRWIQSPEHQKQIELEKRILRRILWAAIGIVAIIVLAKTCTPAKALDVQNDNGGNVAEYVDKVAQLRATGERVEVLGQCLSSCTLYMALDNICTDRGAVWGFHGPSGAYQLALSPARFEEGSMSMAEHYPEPYRSNFLNEWRYITVGWGAKIEGRELIAAGVMGECK
jgi:hypothetical protein